MKTPQGKTLSIISLRQSAESRYIKRKLAVLDSGKRWIQWIKSIYSHQGSNKKGLRRRLLPGKLEDMAKECRKTSCSTLQAFSSINRAEKPPAEVEANDAVEGEFNGAEVSPNSPQALLLGIFLRRWKTGHDLLSLATTSSRRTTLTARLRGEAWRPILAARPPCLMSKKPMTVPRYHKAQH